MERSLRRRTHEHRITSDRQDRHSGQKLHTGRSRNDQVATDIRLYMRDQIDLISDELTRLQQRHCWPGGKSRHHHARLHPPANRQPVTFGHHLLAWNAMLERDYSRLQDCRALNQLPLGAAALAGTTYPIDRHYTAELLGFDKPTDNSLDSVSDRDFAIEFANAASIIMMHLSRFSEELVLWTSAQFKFIDLPDRFCTGSSIMPQKKPRRARAGARQNRARLRSFDGLLTLMKSQPLAYNKDNQEDKEPLFDTVDTVRDSLRTFADMVPNIIARKADMRETAMRGFSTATDLADYLVRKGTPSATLMSCG